LPSIETPRGKLWYADYRHADLSPATPPLLLIHGAGGSYMHFPMLLRHAPARRVLALDLMGHGHSAPPSRASIGDYAADVVAFLEALGVARADVCGHSMGGAIAQTLAIEHGALVQRLILIGTGAKLGVHPDLMNGVLNEFKAVARTIIDWSWGGTDKRLKDIGYKTLVGTPAEVVYNDYSACNAFDVRSRLNEIQCPTLVMSGSADQMTPARSGEYLAHHIANAQFVLIPDGGHMMALEQPTLVTETILAWLAKPLATGS
jgi:pimeloyl-ACP methyl ester carboxylesterase